jgi:hypothetical protein
VDLRQATAEQAAYELAKPAEKVSILVQYNLESKKTFFKSHLNVSKQFFHFKNTNPSKINLAIAISFVQCSIDYLKPAIQLN